MNEFILTGTALGSPEIRKTDSGLEIAEIQINVNKNYKNKDGSQDKDLIKVNVFNKLTEETQDIFDGTTLIIKGHITANNVTKDGKVTCFPNIVADRIEKLK